jgi:hypothetical protein
MQKYEAGRVKQVIEEILWQVWDPIGMKEITDAPRDEYSGYVNRVLELLTSGASDDVIANHLLQIATERMGLTEFTIADMRPTVAALRAIELAQDWH